MKADNDSIISSIVNDAFAHGTTKVLFKKKMICKTLQMTCISLLEFNYVSYYSMLKTRKIIGLYILLPQVKKTTISLQSDRMCRRFVGIIIA